jgi:plasmid replication initiation protein
VVEVKAVDGNGIATIYDRDMLLYIASLLQQRVKTNPEIANDHKNRENRTFTFTLSDFCEATSRSRGSGYDRVEDIVERLRTTSIRTGLPRDWGSHVEQAITGQVFQRLGNENGVSFAPGRNRDRRFEPQRRRAGDRVPR